ncbi:hypothetical protein [Amaricoccus sp.]|uniref:hypothetical protein n=1 Tax=Amaricoccus sp. TaxID=1872485 RepID=UPI001B3DC9A1|nr:hypothetical protein [Amaricoccus sp.]MBP7242128.1 hypothetical protein [Amaricoccus sp.]
MSNLEIGDLVVLTAGSMRMAVERIDGESVACVWCHEGRIGRDLFDARLLKKWEHREEEHRSARGDGPRPGRPDRDGGRFAPRDKADRGDRGGDRDDKPRGKPGWDGKPREKKFFRKD